MTDHAFDSYIRNLKEERATLVARMRVTLDTATREKRALDGEDRQTVERIETKIADLDEQIRGFEEQREADVSGRQYRTVYADVVQPANDGRGNRNPNDEMRALLSTNGSFDLPGMARRFTAEGRIETRDLLTDAATGGQTTVPVGFLAQLREYLTTVSGIWQLRTTLLSTGDGAPMTVPRNTASGTAAIVGEGTALAESDPAYGSVTLSSWKYGRLLQYSNEMRDDTGIDLAGHLARESARALQLGYGPTFAGGGAHTAAPEGLFHGVTVAGTAQTGSTGVPSYNDLVDLQFSVPSQYRNNQCQWFMSDSAVAAVRKITDDQHRPLWQPSVQAGVPDALLGYNIVSDNNVAAIGTAAGTPIMFGDFSGYYLRDVGVRYEISTDYAFNADLTTVRVIQRLDGAWVDVNGVRSLKSPTT